MDGVSTGCAENFHAGDEVEEENAEEYGPGGYHPVNHGDILGAR